MAYKIVSVYKRPSVSVQWHTKIILDQALDDQTRILCYQTHQGRHFRTAVETDTLTLELTQIWPTKEMYETVKKHTARIELTKLAAEYNQRMGIILESLVTEEIDFDLD